MALPPSDQEFVQKIASALETRANLRLGPARAAESFCYQVELASRALTRNFTHICSDPLLAQALAFSALLVFGKHMENFCNVVTAVVTKPDKVKPS